MCKNVVRNAFTADLIEVCSTPAVHTVKLSVILVRKIPPERFRGDSFLPYALLLEDVSSLQSRLLFSLGLLFRNFLLLTLSRLLRVREEVLTR